MGNRTHYRPTRANIDLEAIRNNVRNVKNHLTNASEIIAVVKADGYGHGDVEVAAAALEAGAKMVAVATPDEAVRLRMAGISGDILVMGPSPSSFASKAAELGISVTVWDAAWLRQVSCDRLGCGNQLKLHVKIDSGMGRIGLRDVDALHALVSFVEQLGAVRTGWCFYTFRIVRMKNIRTKRLNNSKYLWI